MMTREQVLRIIEKERLKNYNMNQGRMDKENEVGICRKDGLWTVYATDERASVVIGSETIFENESDAWENFIKRLRADKALSDF